MRLVDIDTILEFYELSDFAMLYYIHENITECMELLEMNSLVWLYETGEIEVDDSVSLYNRYRTHKNALLVSLGFRYDNERGEVYYGCVR